MPLIHVYHPTGALTPERKAALAEKLTHVVIEIEGGPGVDGPRARAIAWVMFHEVAADSWAIGGTFDDSYVSPPGKFLVKVQVPEGALSQARKAMVHRSVDEAFFEVFGLGAPPAPEDRKPSILVMIHEWGEGNVGGFGRTYGLADIIAFAGDGSGKHADPAIAEHVQAYLQARTAWREAAGLPV